MIELLVAIVCLSIILIAFTRIFEGLTTSWRVGFARADLKQNFTVAAGRMMAEMRSMLPPYVQDNANEIWLDGSDASQGAAGMTGSIDDVIKFHGATRSTYEGVSTDYGSDMQRIIYWLKSESATDIRIQRDFRASTYSDPIVDLYAAGANSPFALHMRAFDVYYRNTNGTWVDRFSSQNAANPYNPNLIRITLGGEIGGVTDTFVLTLRPQAWDTNITR